MSNTRHLGRKLDDSLPDFATFVVSGCRKWGKRDALYSEIVDLDPYWRCGFCFTCLSDGSKKQLPIFYADSEFSHKKTRRSGFFRKLFSAGAEAN
ncbi:hypothetical protein [Shigella flexneri]|uniref:hypothetical protein n=1 Tax=Shigella flexneri TaxID=623 RepID=UPI00148FD73B|nr:hypothetical protein [Shigella flexneri]